MSGVSGHRGDTCFRKKRKIHDIYFTFSKTNLSRARKERERANDVGSDDESAEKKDRGERFFVGFDRE